MSGRYLNIQAEQSLGFCGVAGKQECKKQAVTADCGEVLLITSELKKVQ